MINKKYKDEIDKSSNNRYIVVHDICYFHKSFNNNILKGSYSKIIIDKFNNFNPMDIVKLNADKISINDTNIRQINENLSINKKRNNNIT